MNPKRTYSLAYDGAKVCKPIVSALNKAVNGNHKKAIARVTFPTPGQADGDVTISKNVPATFHSQNPLFSDPMFIRWKPKGGTVPEGFAYSPSDWTDRWLIVDLENNGTRYLVTNDAVVWNVSQEQLNKTDWNISANWKPFKPLLDPWPDAPYGAENTNPVDRWRTLTWSIPGNPQSNLPTNWRFPKFQPEKIPAQWQPFNRRTTGIEFAQIEGKIYTIFYDRIHDLMIVDDLSRKLGEDLCYIQSDINDKIRL